MLGRGGARRAGRRRGQQDGGADLPAVLRAKALLKKPLAARPRSQRCSAGIPPVHAQETGHLLPCSAAL